MMRENSTIKKLLMNLGKRLQVLTGNEFEFDCTLTTEGINVESDYFMSFVDQGVKGTKSGSSKAGFKYGNKMPPPSAFEKYTSDKSTQFAIAKSVQQKGIKAKNYTDKFMQDYKVLDIVADIYAEQILD